MNGQLTNRVAIVTGASRGIGYAIAEAYLRAGARIAVCARDETRLREAATRLSGLGEVLAVPCDVSDLERVARMVEEAMSRFGRIDVLVNNAGIGMTYGRAGEIDPKRWAYVIAVNLIGTFNCCHAVIPRMMEQGRGKIINLKGYGADFPSPRATAYGASKAAIVALTRSLAREYKKDGITVNTLSPGVVKTGLLLNREATEEGRPHLERFNPMIDLLAVPVERSAALAVKMASSESDGITGKGFRVTSRTAFFFRAVRFGVMRLWRG
jgi:NAD(P)-dependent dehydrogenase (short-subunit alcohol dehydrogenase family)